MINDVINYFNVFPQAFMGHFEIPMEAIDPKDWEALVDYKSAMLNNMGMAIAYQIDEAAEELLIQTIDNLKFRGLAEEFEETGLPVQSLIIQVERPDFDTTIMCLITDYEGVVSADVFESYSSGIGFYGVACMIEGTSISLGYRSVKPLMELAGLKYSPELINAVTEHSKYMTALAFALMHHLKRGETILETSKLLVPRAERRRAARLGVEKPNTLISKITLTKEGHRRAANYKPSTTYASIKPKRAHWVIGHEMRTKSGKTVWREGHKRGAGEPTLRVRRVTAVPQFDGA